jgi:hypothetical protein
LPIPVISATRLKTVAACERKYAGQYLFGLKEEQGAGAQFGEQFHKAAELYQETGDMGVPPESAIGKLIRAGGHYLRRPGSGALIEYEHRGFLPDGDAVRGIPGTPFVAYLDASDPAPVFGSMQVETTFGVDDQKTTSDAARALTDQTLLTDLQAMFYAWIVVTPHWYARRLPHGYYGPQQWMPWKPGDRIREVALRWNYFLTRGPTRAWQARAFAKLDTCREFMKAEILPLVRRIRALHAAHDAGTLTELNDAPRDLHGCDGVGHWCGAFTKCNFSAEGLVQLRTINSNNKDTNNMGLAELRAKYGQKPSTAVESAPAPAPAAPATLAEYKSLPVVEADEATEESAPEAPPVEPAPAPAPRARKPRQAPPAAPPAPEGDTINPPEAKVALAQIRAEVAAANDAAPASSPAPESGTVPAVHEMAAKGAAAFSTEQLRDELCRRGYTVSLTRGAAA